MSFRMTRPTRRAVVTAAAGATALTGAAVFGLPSAGAAPSASNAVTVPAGFTATTFATGGTLAGPDDISRLDGSVFVAYQNGVGSAGEPSATGAKDSTLVEYAPNGDKIASWNVTGKIDGMTADTAQHRIVATVNEDGNSSLYTVTPGEQVRHYTYSQNPLPHGGGTDSIAFDHGRMFITASAPAANADGTTYSKPALYEVTLSGATATAKPVLSDNSTATDATTGKNVTLNLSDPDSSTVLPQSAPRFGGQLLLDSQGDSEQIFLADPGTPRQHATVLHLNTQVDDTTVATKESGTLYVTDGGANRVVAIRGAFSRGEVFTAVPSDSSTLAGTLGRLNLTTGTVTAFGTGFTSPKGLLFVPDGVQNDDNQN